MRRWPATRRSSTVAEAAGGLADAHARRLDELVASRLVRGGRAAAALPLPAPDRPPAAYESAGAGWRLGAHARAAAALAAAGGRPAARAHHLERCAAPGDDDGDRRARRRPATRRRRSAPAEAARWYAAALRLLPAEDGRRLELLAPLATALASTGQLERALATLLEVLAVVPPEFAELRAKLVAACAGCENLLGRHGDAHDRLERALADLAGRATRSRSRCCEGELAADALYDSDFEALAAAASRARASAEAPATPGSSR